MDALDDPSVCSAGTPPFWRGCGAVSAFARDRPRVVVGKRFAQVWRTLRRYEGEREGRLAVAVMYAAVCVVFTVLVPRTLLFEASPLLLCIWLLPSSAPYSLAPFPSSVVCAAYWLPRRGPIIISRARMRSIGAGSALLSLPRLRTGRLSIERCLLFQYV